MSRRAGRDTWLYSNTGSGRRLEKKVAKAEGRIEPPASEFVQRMLAGAPVPMQITNWGGVDKSSNVQPIRKMIPEYPATKQLKDPFEGLYSQGIALEPPLPPDRLLNLTEENTLHSGCLMAKAYDSCGRGWDFEPVEGKKGDKALVESKLPDKFRLAMEALTPELTFGEMLYQAAWEMDAIGWSVWETVRTMDGYVPGTYAPIGALYPIPSFTMRATIDPRRWVQIRAGRVRFFKKFGAQCDIDAESGQVYDWKSPTDMQKLKILDPARVASELIIFKSYTPRSLWYGIPKWISCVPTIAELTAIREFNVSWFASGGQTDYLIHFKADNIETAKQMSAEVRQQLQENQGRGHTNLVVAGDGTTDMNVEKLGELLREGHFRFRRSDLAKEVLIAHNVPPYRIGWAETGQGSGLAGNPASEMLAAYKYGSIEPIQTIIEDRLRMTLFDKDMGVATGEFRLKLKELELDDMEKELDRVVKLVDSAIMTPNQAREELGLDPVEKVASESGEEKPQQPGEEKPEGEQEIGPDGQPVQNAFGPDGQPMPQENPQAAGTRPGGDNSGGNLNGPAGTEGEDVGQVEAMNTYYYKGEPLSAKPQQSAPKIGPDGKPMNPFGGKPSGGGFPRSLGPDGSPEPDAQQKSVDKALEVISSFEQTLKNSLRRKRGTKSAGEGETRRSGRLPRASALPSPLPAEPPKE